MTSEFGDDVRYVDLAPITDPERVPVTVVGALGLLDQPHRSAIDTIVRHLSERQLLLVLDNCEHLPDACAALIVAVLDACPGVTMLTTSRVLKKSERNPLCISTRRPGI
ncbi:putative ATPase [Mycobacterium sp. AZCC_0083]|nr:putative ATPase [Mycobacterium sp. AZCC_0083]